MQRLSFYDDNGNLVYLLELKDVSYIDSDDYQLYVVTNLGYDFYCKSMTVEVLSE